MSKDKTYILRRPIKAKRMNSENWRDIFEVDMPASWDAEQSITYELQEDDFNKTFVEFDENATLKQIEELIYPFIEMSEREGYYALENPELFHELDEADSATDVIVNKLLALLGGTTNE